MIYDEITFSLDNVDSNTEIRALKQRAEELLRVPGNKQKFFINLHSANRVQLHDNDTLDDYPVAPEDTIFVYHEWKVCAP